MGAGDHVTEHPALFYSRIALKITGSLFFRPDGFAVENKGAVPDYPYIRTRSHATTLPTATAIIARFTSANSMSC